MLQVAIKVSASRIAGLHIAYGHWLNGSVIPPGSPNTEPADDLVDVSLPVPADRLNDFYLMTGCWLAGAKTPKTPTAGTSAEPQPERAPWTAADTDLAPQVWAKLTDQARALFNIMIDAPGELFDGDALANALDLAHGKLGIAGLLSWPSRHAAAVGRQIFWVCYIGPEGPSGPCEYSMTAEQADLFRAARDLPAQ